MSKSPYKRNDLIHVHELPATQPSDICFVWAHGWMRSHQDFSAIASHMTDYGNHYLLDLPGHGSTCTTAISDQDIDGYLEPIKTFVSTINKPIIWIGHSFGCRIGSHMGKHYPDKIKALFLICPPFNQRTLTFKRFMALSKQSIYKACIAIGIPRNTLLPWFASADYLSAGEMRSLFVKWVNEDSSQTLNKLSMPVQLVFAEKDTETPPKLETYFKKHCRHAQSITLKYFDHLSILTDGQHQITHTLSQFLKHNTK